MLTLLLLRPAQGPGCCSLSLHGAVVAAPCGSAG
jgi:hypothetical protein